MGFLGKTKEDPLIKLVQSLAEQLERQQNDHQKATERLIEQITEQNAIMRSILAQYVSHGQPTTEGLNSRLERQEQYVAESEWEPLGNNPFEGF